MRKFEKVKFGANDLDIISYRIFYQTDEDFRTWLYLEFDDYIADLGVLRGSVEKMYEKI